MEDIAPVFTRLIDDPEDLAEAIHHATFHPCQISARLAPSRLTRVICPEVCLDFVSLGTAMLFTGTMPAEFYTLIFVTDCERKGRAFNFAVEHNDGYMGFFPPGGELDAYAPEGYANATLTVSAPVFEAAVSRLYPNFPASAMRHGAAVRVGAAQQAPLRGLLKAVMEGVDDPSAPLVAEAARRQLGIDLFDVFLSALRSGCESPVPPPPPRVTARLRRIKQARDFLTDHVHEPLALKDLCAEMGMSKRGVEMLFHDSVGIGPNEFLRHQRLHGVRRALQSAPCASGVVKQIALNWGFWHMGHFATDYREMFGESPSVTLSRVDMNTTRLTR